MFSGDLKCFPDTFSDNLILIKEALITIYTVNIPTSVSEATVLIFPIIANPIVAKQTNRIEKCGVDLEPIIEQTLGKTFCLDNPYNILETTMSIIKAVLAVANKAITDISTMPLLPRPL